MLNKNTTSVGISVFIFLMLHTYSFAQGRLGYLAGGGVMMYSGDIRPNYADIASNVKILKPFARAGINYRFTDHVEASAMFLYGSVTGADSLSEVKEKQIRNQSFKSEIEELSIQLEYKLFSTARMRKFNPYVFGGFGVFHFNPKAELNGTWYELQPIGTEGQYISESNYVKPYKLIDKVGLAGAGINVQLNNNWRLRLDYAVHFTFTDFLDDVSTVYPDSGQLSRTPNGALAVTFSNRRLESKYPKTNRSRGSPEHNDVYSHLGLTLIYNPGAYYSSTGYENSGYKGKYYKSLKKKRKCPSYKT